MSENPHIDETREFFDDSWEIYQIAIDRNYMVHAEIIDCVRKELERQNTDRISILELGCGDSHVISEVAETVPIDRYCGIDFSKRALAFGRKNLTGKIANFDLIEADMITKPREMESSFDVILAGYTVHHLTSEDKSKLFQTLASRLSENGSILIWDILTNEDENRDTFVQRLMGNIRNWSAYNQEQIEAMISHVKKNDFPETWNSISSMARDAGLTNSELLYRDPNEIWALMKFS